MLLTNIEKQKVDEYIKSGGMDVTSFIIQMKLANTDWTQLVDSPVDKQAWAVYRQALRDINKQSDYPNNIVWPTAPTN